VKPSWLTLEGISKRDFTLAGAAGIFGLLVSFLPYRGPDLSKPGANSWIRNQQIGQYMLAWPWVLLVTFVLVLLLFHARFKRGGLGVAFCLGIVVRRMVASFI